jgi:hypothetical protein
MLQYKKLYLSNAPISQMPLDIYKKLRKLDKASNLSHDTTSVTPEELKIITNFYSSPFEVNFINSMYQPEQMNKIENWCKLNYLNNVVVVRYIRDYIKFNKNIRTTFPKKPTSLTSPPTTHDIIRTFLSANGHKVLFRTGNNTYQNCFNLHTPSVFRINKPLKPATLLNNNFFGEYVMCMNLVSSKNTISIVNNVDAQTIQSAVKFMYSPSSVKNFEQLAQVNVHSVNNIDMNYVMTKFIPTVTRVVFDMRTYYTDIIYYDMIKDNSNDADYCTSLRKYIETQKKILHSS